MFKHVPFSQIRIYVYLFFLFLVTSCASSHINERKIDKSAFPPEFGKPEQILLLEKRTRGITKGQINRRLERSFKKSYTGKFEMASKEEIESNPKYADTNIYRFVLSDMVWASYRSTRTTTSTHTSIDYQNAYRLDYHFHDRVTNTNYSDIGVSSNSFPKAIKRVSAVVNKRLKK